MKKNEMNKFKPAWIQMQVSTNGNPVCEIQFGQMVECSFKNYVVLGSSPVAVTYFSLRGGTDGSELSRIGGLPHLGEISASLRISYKSMSSYEK